tara:strand:+ start:5866 stop:6288 length:423 start_codon:yes stop_codon:yes gene_type:complete
MDAATPQAEGTLTHRLCDRVLSTVRRVDKGASISSVAKWDRDDSTLVRIKSSDTLYSTALQAALRCAWPLARVTTVENYVEGTTEAQILLPSEAEQRFVAYDMATNAPHARRLGRLAGCLLMAGVVAFSVALTAAVAPHT